MRVLDRWRDRKQPRLYSVLLAVGPDEQAPAPGDTVTVDELGSCLVVRIRPIDSPQPNLEPGELAYGADVQVPEIR